MSLLPSPPKIITIASQLPEINSPSPQIPPKPLGTPTEVSEKPKRQISALMLALRPDRAYVGVAKVDPFIKV